MKHVLISLAIILLAAVPVRADSWIFQRSYYSHDPATQVRIGRQVSNGPLYTRRQGEFINSGYRNIRSVIQVGGQTYDNLNMWESWIQVGGQF